MISERDLLFDFSTFCSADIDFLVAAESRRERSGKEVLEMRKKFVFRARVAKYVVGFLEVIRERVDAL